MKVSGCIPLFIVVGFFVCDAHQYFQFFFVFAYSRAHLCVCEYWGNFAPHSFPAHSLAYYSLTQLLPTISLTSLLPTPSYAGCASYVSILR